MGQMTNMQIAEWQKQAGIEPATGERATALDDLSRQAYELIRVIELERSGIRDGDGYWHGSDGLGGTVRNIAALWGRCERSLIDAANEFGSCPECGNAGVLHGGPAVFLNDGSDHWFICETHRTKWLIGSNLFSAWHDLSAEEAAAQRGRLREYRQVDPFHPEPTERTDIATPQDVALDASIPF